eukprot:1240723-Prymnesium_polylepis.1
MDSRIPSTAYRLQLYFGRALPVGGSAQTRYKSSMAIGQSRSPHFDVFASRAHLTPHVSQAVHTHILVH